jgi:hypothetical protein
MIVLQHEVCTPQGCDSDSRRAFSQRQRCRGGHGRERFSHARRSVRRRHCRRRCFCVDIARQWTDQRAKQSARCWSSSRRSRRVAAACMLRCSAAPVVSRHARRQRRRVLALGAAHGGVRVRLLVLQKPGAQPTLVRRCRRVNCSLSAHAFARLRCLRGIWGCHCARPASQSHGLLLLCMSRVLRLASGKDGRSLPVRFLEAPLGVVGRSRRRVLPRRLRQLPSFAPCLYAQFRSARQSSASRRLRRCVQRAVRWPPSSPTAQRLGLHLQIC